MLHDKIYFYPGTTCGGVYSEPNGVVTSPNYPNVYDNRLYCIYLMRIHNCRSVTFYFTDFTTEIFKDSLEYGLGSTVDFNQAIEVFEGNLTDERAIPDPVSIVGYSQASWFLFTTDRNIRLKGFEMIYFAGELLQFINGIKLSPILRVFYSMPRREVVLSNVKK